MSIIKNWLRRKLRCQHHDVYMKFVRYHTGDDRHTGDGVGAVYVQTRGKCPDCGGSVHASVRLPNVLRDLFHANFNECMKEDPDVIALNERNQTCQP